MDQNYKAWNNFVLLSDPLATHSDPILNSAAIANSYMGGANSGGIRDFLEWWKLGTQEVLDALYAVDATVAASQLGLVLERLGQPLLATSQHQRVQELDDLWTDDLNEFDCLSEEADADLMQALERHVASYEAYYLSINDDP